MALALACTGPRGVAVPGAPPAPQKPTIHIGFVGNGDSTSPWHAAFAQELQAQGFTDGQNITIDYRYANGNTALLDGYVAELLSLGARVLVTIDTPSTAAAQKATTTVPIVFVAASDPVGSGFVQSLAQPGGNITGMTTFASDLAPKRLEVLRELIPSVSLLAVTWDATNPVRQEEWEQTQDAAADLGIQTIALPVSSPSDVQPMLAEAAAAGSDAIEVFGDPLFGGANSPFPDVASQYHLPTFWERPELVQAGGLIAYGPSLEGFYRESAVIVAKLLRGASPADLPVEEPTEYDLVINTNTAQSLGLTVPDSVVSQATQVFP